MVAACLETCFEKFLSANSRFTVKKYRDQLVIPAMVMQGDKGGLSDIYLLSLARDFLKLEFLKKSSLE